jgi:DNA polymerase alpha-associated DNA helicase A
MQLIMLLSVVAMTRPRRHLCIVGDSETVSRYVGFLSAAYEMRRISILICHRGSLFLKRWMAFLEEHADLRYPDPSELRLS